MFALKNIHAFKNKKNYFTEIKLVIVTPAQISVFERKQSCKFYEDFRINGKLFGIYGNLSVKEQRIVLASD